MLVYGCAARGYVLDIGAQATAALNPAHLPCARHSSGSGHWGSGQQYTPDAVHGGRVEGGPVEVAEWVVGPAWVLPLLEPARQSRSAAQRIAARSRT